VDGRLISGDRQTTRSEIMARANKAAGGLAELGIGENDAVAMVLRNDFAFFEAAFGAAKIGAYAVPVNWHFRSEEVRYILTDSGARAVLVHADLLPQLADAFPEGIAVFAVPTPPEIRDTYGIPADTCDVPDGCTNWNDWLATQPEWTGEPRSARTNMIYTSGTTGQPKGVRRQPATSEMQQRMAEITETIFGIGADTAVRTVITGPVYHSAPNFYALNAAQFGELMVLQPRFDAEQLLQLVEQHRITHLHMVPIMFVRLLALPDEVKRKYDLSSLQFVVHAAAPCAPDVKRQMIEWWGPVINEYYGGTETGGVVFHTSEEALAKPGTVGRAITGANVTIFNADGDALPAGQVGEIFMRIEGWPDFTYNAMDEKRKEVEHNGLITCGDVGYLDDDGYLFICDRVRDMVISGGVNIYPAEIEGTLITMPGVRDCAVFGIPDDEYGEKLCAYVEPDEGDDLSADDVQSWLKAHLASYKVPRVIEFQDSLPREDSGKIFKRKLRAPYWAGAGRQI